MGWMQVEQGFSSFFVKNFFAIFDDFSKYSAPQVICHIEFWSLKPDFKAKKAKLWKIIKYGKKNLGENEEKYNIQFVFNPFHVFGFGQVTHH